MRYPRITTTFLLAAAGVLQAQGQASPLAAQLPAHATLPVSFTQTISAANARPGELVRAKTIQAVRLEDGRSVAAGALVSGHVLSAKAFVYDKTPYAKQQAGMLSIQIDSIDVQGTQVPLHVTLRAMADPLTTWDATKPQPSDLDPVHTTTQIGGDLLTPSQSEIRNAQGDVVGYNKRGGAYAHLLANASGSLSCDAGETEQPVSLFSASACGLYGFANVSLGDGGPSGIGLTSTHRTPEIVKHSIALLETVPAAQGN